MQISIRITFLVKIMEKVEVLMAEEMQKLFDEIKEEILDYVCNKEENTEKAQGMLNALKIVEKHIENKGV